MSQRESVQRRRTLMLLAGLTLGIAACGSAGDTDDAAERSTTEQADGDTVDQSGETDTADTETETTDTDTDADADAGDAPVTDQTTTSDEVVELTVEFQDLDAGRYRISGLGTAMEVDVPDGWAVQPNDQSHVVLTPRGSQGPGDRDIVFVRATGLIDIDQAGDPAIFEPETAGAAVQPASTFQAWAQTLGDDVLDGPIDNDVSIGGRAASMVPIRLDPETDIECLDEMFGCLHLVDSAGIHTLFVDRGVLYHLYWVELDEEVPMAILVGAGDDDAVDFFPEAEALLNSLTWGDVGPHQLGVGDGERLESPWELGLPANVPAGDATLPMFGGVTLTLDRDLYIFQDDGFGALVDFEAGPMELDMLDEVWDLDGNRVTTTDQLVEVMADFNPIELDTVTIDGREARVFDIEPERTEKLTLFHREEHLGTDVGWRTPALGRVWVIEAPDGVWIFTAESFQGEGPLEDAIAMAEAIYPTMRFAS